MFLLPSPPIVNRPGVAKAVLHAEPLIPECLNKSVMIFLQRLENTVIHPLMKKKG